MPVEDMGEIPYVPTKEREAGLKSEAFEAGFWAWKSRVEGDGPVEVFPSKALTSLTNSPYEFAIVQRAYIDGLATAIAQEKCACH